MTWRRQQPLVEKFLKGKCTRGSRNWTPAGGPGTGHPEQGKVPKNGSDDELWIKLRHYSGLLSTAQCCSCLAQSCTATAQDYLLMA